jgi:hypothetical protein
MAIRQAWVDVTNAATSLVAGTSDDNRADYVVGVRNEAAEDVFLGGSDVTSAVGAQATRGIRLKPGEFQSYVLGGEALYARADTAGPHAVAVIYTGVA